MGNKDILDKLMFALNSFSNHELRQLAILFKDPDVNEAIVKVIEGTLSLRKAERKSKAVNGAKFSTRIEAKREATEKNDVTDREAKRGTTFKTHIKQKVATLLANKNLFPSTKDVISAVNRSFKWQISYDDFYKRGRRDLIRKCLKELSTYSESEQRKIVKSFLEGVDKQPGEIDQEYRTLFKILAGDE